jgi:hypothetical protein
MSAGENSANHLYLPGPRSGLFNRQAARSHKQIILTESIIDSLTLINSGISNTIPCYGVNGFTDDHMQWLKRCEVETVRICFDADESGCKAADKTAATLEGQGFKVHRIDLADGQDINDFFLLTADPVPSFKKLVGLADPQEKAKQAALAMLKNPALFDEILSDFETIGYAGEAMGKLLCYIAAISRKMDEPLSVMIQSRSAVGKSYDLVHWMQKK